MVQVNQAASKVRRNGLWINTGMGGFNSSEQRDASTEPDDRQGAGRKIIQQTQVLRSEQIDL